MKTKWRNEVHRKTQPLPHTSLIRQHTVNQNGHTASTQPIRESHGSDGRQPTSSDFACWIGADSIRAAPIVSNAAKHTEHICSWPCPNLAKRFRRPTVGPVCSCLKRGSQTVTSLGYKVILGDRMGELPNSVDIFVTQYTDIFDNIVSSNSLDNIRFFSECLKLKFWSYLTNCHLMIPVFFFLTNATFNVLYLFSYSGLQILQIVICQILRGWLKQWVS